MRGESVGRAVVYTWAIGDHDLELVQSFNVADHLAFAVSALLGEVLNVLTVCQNKGGVIQVSKIVAPVFKAFDYSQEFSVVDVIIALRR